MPIATMPIATVNTADDIPHTQAGIHTNNARNEDGSKTSRSTHTQKDLTRIARRRER